MMRASLQIADRARTVTNKSGVPGDDIPPFRGGGRYQSFWGMMHSGEPVSSADEGMRRIPRNFEKKGGDGI